MDSIGVVTLATVHPFFAMIFLLQEVVAAHCWPAKLTGVGWSHRARLETRLQQMIGFSRPMLVSIGRSFRRSAMALLLMSLTAPGLAQVETMRVDGAEMAFEVLGGAGPWIVFESGLGEGMGSWTRVATPLAACARVVLYDRLGVGKSGPLAADGPVLAAAVADRMMALLRAIGASPPYILVGHSLGGLYAQSTARCYPGSVAAVVLVDAASPFEPPGVFVPTAPLAAGSTAAAEEAGVAPSLRAMLAGPPFPDIPLIVLAATDHGDKAEREALWRQVQARTAAMTPKGRLEIVEGSGHFIQDDRPWAVIQAVLEAARDSGADIRACIR